MFYGLLEQPPVAAAGHPLRPSHVAVETAPASRLLAIGIAMQDDPGDFGPVRAVRFGVEQAQISDEMRFVIRRDVRTIWRFIIDIGIKFKFGTHGGALLTQ